MATQSLTGVLLGKEREFEYRTSRPSALRQCKEDCLREASSRFGVIAQYKDIHFRVKRCTREWGEDEKVTKHVKILVEGDLGSHCHREGRSRTGRTRVTGAPRGCSSRDETFTKPWCCCYSCQGLS